VTIIVAQADSVFSTLNFSTGNGGYDICGTAACIPGPGSNVPGVQSLAQRFTSGGNFTLTDAKVVVGNQNGSSPLFNVWVAQDLGGMPGSSIEQIGFNVSYSGTDVIATGGTGGEVTADSVATPILLTKGTSYWVVLTPADPSTIVYWDTGGPANVPLSYPCLTCFAISHTVDGIGGWFPVGGHIGGQVQIDGTPFVPTEVVPTPEPSSYWIFTVTTLGLCTVKRWSALFH
jgi:hypothetical protein